jgi:DNA polymerase-3 subunit epsilon
MRQVALDTETTGLSTKNGDRIVEIGCVEIINRTITGNTFHTYCNPERLVSKQTTAITGIEDQLLIDKPKFATVVDDFVKFVSGAELIIHNAAFDLGFINYELQLAKHSIIDISSICSVVDTLVLARERHPGQRNNLDALSKRYNINVERKLHGALLDAEILAKLILKMTAGQINLDFVEEQRSVSDSLNKSDHDVTTAQQHNINQTKATNLKILYANQQELTEHDAYRTEVLQLQS